MGATLEFYTVDKAGLEKVGKWPDGDYVFEGARSLIQDTYLEIKGVYKLSEMVATVLGFYDPEDYTWLSRPASKEQLETILDETDSVKLNEWCESDRTIFKEAVSKMLSSVDFEKHVVLCDFA